MARPCLRLRRVVADSVHRRRPQVLRLRVVSVVRLRLRAVVTVVRLQVADSAALRRIPLEAPPRGEGVNSVALRQVKVRAATVVRRRKATTVRRRARRDRVVTVARRRKISISR